MPVSKRRKESHLCSQNLRMMREWLSGEVFWKFELFAIPVTEVRKYLKSSHTFVPERCCNQPLERQLFTVLFWKRPLEIKIFIKPYFLIPRCCVLGHAEDYTGNELREVDGMSLPEWWFQPEPTGVQPWGSLFVLTGSLGSASPIHSPLIWSLSMDLSLRNYSVAIKDAMCMRRCKKSIPFKIEELSKPPTHVCNQTFFLTILGLSWFMVRVMLVVTSSALDNETTRPWSQVMSSWKCFKLFMHLKPHLNTELLFSLKLFKLTSFIGKKTLACIKFFGLPYFYFQTGTLSFPLSYTIWPYWILCHLISLSSSASSASSLTLRVFALCWI